MSKSPAFQFYAAEFLADENVVMMSNQELGCYIKLMCYCWREGSIPADISKIAKLCSEDGSAMAQLWLSIGTCFDTATFDADRLVHPRLEKEREKQKAFKDERSAAGKKGAKAKWGAASKGDGSANGSANGSAIKEPMAKYGSSSSSSSSSSKDIKPAAKKSVGQNDAEVIHPPIEELFPEVDVRVLKEWEAIRRTKHLGKVTLTAAEGVRREAQKSGLDIRKAIAFSVERSWGGFRASWYEKDKPSTSESGDQFAGVM
jgi:uncharacterized protein YdaU (DUF1376 family)